VVDALADLDRVRAQWHQAYTRFSERFCSLEDGRATQRVLERFFPDSRTAEEAP
jgi:CDP-glycerol glycerophosphotransferase